MLKPIQRYFHYLIYALKNFTRNPIDSLRVLIPNIIVIFSSVVFVIAYIIFLVKYGYSEQSEMFNSLGFFPALVKSFSIDTTTHIMYNKVIVCIVLYLLIFDIGIMLITFFMQEKRIKKFLTAVALIAVLLMISLLSIMILCADTISEAFSSVSLLLIIGAIVSVITLLCKSSVGHTLKQICQLAIYSFVILPGVLWLIAHKAGLILLVIAAIIFGIVTLIKGFINHCPKCQRIFAAKCYNDKLINRADTLENATGIKYGMYNNYTGTAVYHTELRKKMYICKYCGHKWERKYRESYLKDFKTK